MEDSGERHACFVSEFCLVVRRRETSWRITRKLRAVKTGGGGGEPQRNPSAFEAGFFLDADALPWFTSGTGDAKR